QKVMISAEEYLEDYYFPLHVQLCLSDQYNLYALQRLKRIFTSKEAAEVTNSESYQHFSCELKDELIEMMVGMQTEVRPKVQWPTLN
ncbi:hypothetical protein PENTCL1PPCAC_23611, partial [Pristionchus entomophagus]